MEPKTELCDIAFKYQSDKCPEIKHFYTRHYYKMFKDRRNDVKKLFEIGIGSKKTIRDSQPGYITGASLLMWRDFFPNAQIYGIDIDESCMFESERIKTFVASQSKEEDLKRMVETIGSDIDIVIDDGSHRTDDQWRSCATLMPLLKKDVIYVIEDVKSSRFIIAKLRRTYNIEFVDHFRPRHKDDRLVIVTNK